MKDKPLDMPVTLWKRLGKSRKLFEDFSNETDWHDGYWLYLESGYINANLECHFIHEQTIQAVIDELQFIMPCNCKACQGLNGVDELADFNLGWLAD